MTHRLRLQQTPTDAKDRRAADREWREALIDVLTSLDTRLEKVEKNQIWITTAITLATGVAGFVSGWFFRGM